MAVALAWRDRPGASAIAEEWPPFTNWSGSEGSYPKPAQWAASIELLQRPYGMEPGEQVSD